MNRTALFLFALLLTGFGVPRVSAQGSLSACHSRADGLYDAKSISAVRRGEMRRDCDRAAYGNDPIREEFWAYWIYMASEMEAGRISREQARYQVMQKENELEAKRRSEILQILPYAAQQQQPAYRPVVPQQRSPVYTNCTRDPWGNVNCVTQ